MTWLPTEYVVMRLLSRKVLRDEFGITYSDTHYRRISNPQSEWYLGFPTPILMGRRVVYREDEVVVWIASRPRKDPPPLRKEQEEPPMGQLPPPLKQLPDYTGR
jgi:hypothetical protein